MAVRWAGREAVVVIGADYAPLPNGPPVVLPSMTSSCAYAAGLAFLAAPSALRGRLRVFPITGGGGAVPSGWKRKATDSVQAIRVWARSYPSAPMAARTGVSTGLVVVQADDADALAAVEQTFGALPPDTVRSVSRNGRLRVWMRLPATVRTCPTRRDLVPRCRILADGAYCRLPPSGRWTTPPDDPDSDYRLIPSGWIAAAVALDTPPTPTIRFFN